MGGGHHHRAGAQRQSNKRHKNRNASKRSITRQSGGKIDRQNPKFASIHSNKKKQSSSVTRKLKQKQARASKIAETRFSSHLKGDSPTIVGVICLSRNGPAKERSFLEMCKSSSDYDCSKYQLWTSSDFMTSSENTSLIEEDVQIQAVLDLTRICQVLVVVFQPDDSDIAGDGDDISMQMDGTVTSSSCKSSTAVIEKEVLSDQGERILAAVKAQGVPGGGILGALMLSLEKCKKPKLVGERKKFVQRLLTTEFGTHYSKMVDFKPTHSAVPTDVQHNKGQMNLLMRSFMSVRQRGCSPAKWAAIRSFLPSTKYEYDGNRQELSLYGYVRGSGFVVAIDDDSEEDEGMDMGSQGNIPAIKYKAAIVHVPNMGTFRTKSIHQINDNAKHSNNNHGNKEDEAVVLWESSLEDDEDNDGTLSLFAQPDALEGEQNLVGFDEDNDHNFDDDDGSMDNCDNHSTSKEDKDISAQKKPELWSDYQAAWLEGMTDDQVRELMEDGEDMAHTNDAFNSKTEMDMDDKEGARKREDYQSEQQFPDEFELKPDELGQERLARYRSLKSFRESNWDPRENLPESYAKLYQLEDFKSTQREVLDEHDQHVKFAVNPLVSNGTYVKLVIGNVTEKEFSKVNGNNIITAVALLDHEQKASVCHFNIQMTSNCEPGEMPVKSKDVLIVRCGWRTWKSRPIFSEQNLNSHKHKYSKFLSPHVHMNATMFGPITFGQPPVMIYRETLDDNDGTGAKRQQLVAVGSMASCDADSLIIKRKVLTGYPTRVHKRHATVRYMFFNPDDVRWFKPAMLTTKHGLQGNIIQSVGEHGTMKCLFNKPILQHDTVSLPLYKRIYPKFARDEESNEDLVVL